MSSWHELWVPQAERYLMSSYAASWSGCPSCHPSVLHEFYSVSEQGGELSHGAFLCRATKTQTLMTPVLRLAGRSTPCRLRNRPQALQSGRPSASRLQSGVFCEEKRVSVGYTISKESTEHQPLYCSSGISAQSRSTPGPPAFPHSQQGSSFHRSAS